MNHVIFSELSNNKIAKITIEEYAKSMAETYSSVNAIASNYSSFLPKLNHEDGKAADCGGHSYIL